MWTVQRVKPETGAAQRTEGAERTARSEEALRRVRDGDPVWSGLERATRGGTSSPALERTERSGASSPALERAGRSGAAQSGLEGLYRQSVRGLRPAAPALPPEQAGRTARTQEPESAASLAVDELDRAVRRDSRRYDGGMSIY